MRAVTVMVTAGLLLLHAVASAFAAEVGDNGGAEREFVSLIAQERSSRGLGALTEDAELIDVARRHAARMAANKDLHHNPNLQNEVSDWEVLGENVGRGASVAEVHQAFMESESHRAQILEPRYLEVGVGVVWADGEVWVVEVFRKRQEKPSPAPAPEPESDQPVAAATQPAPSPSPSPPASPKPSPAPASVPPAAAVSAAAPVSAPAVAAEATVAAQAVVDADLDGIGAALAQPVEQDAGLEQLSATTIASDIPLTEGVPLVVEFAAALLLLIVGMQTMTLRRLGLV